MSGVRETGIPIRPVQLAKWQTAVHGYTANRGQQVYVVDMWKRDDDV